MGVGVEVGENAWEIGPSSFLHAFFSTVSRNLEPAGWGSRFPALMNYFYQGRIPPQLVEAATAELAQVHQEFGRLPPAEAVWDIEDPSTRPPWGDEVPPEVTTLADYFVTSGGEDLFEVLFRSLHEAKERGQGVSICPY